jgi:hypothetical protein
MRLHHQWAMASIAYVEFICTLILQLLLVEHTDQ